MRCSRWSSCLSSTESKLCRISGSSSRGNAKSLQGPSECPCSTTDTFMRSANVIKSRVLIWFTGCYVVWLSIVRVSKCTSRWFCMSQLVSRTAPVILERLWTNRECYPLASRTVPVNLDRHQWTSTVTSEPCLSPVSLDRHQWALTVTSEPWSSPVSIGRY